MDKFYRGLDAVQFPRVLDRSHLLDRGSGGIPNNRTAARTELLAVTHGDRRRFKADSPARWRLRKAQSQLIEQSVADDRQGHGWADLLTRLDIVAKIGEQRRDPGLDEQKCARTREAGQIADVRKVRHEQAIQPLVLQAVTDPAEPRTSAVCAGDPAHPVFRMPASSPSSPNR